MFHLVSDVRFTLRLMRRSPGFFATLLGVLIAGIGATTAMFSIMESLLLRPLPFPHPEELTMIWATQPLIDPSAASMPDFLDWKAQATTFESMAAIETTAFNLTSEGNKPETLPGASVSGDFFRALGVQPLRGRLLLPTDDQVGAPRVVVISSSLWHSRFGSDPNVIGRALSLNSQAYTVVGVAAEGFQFASAYTRRAEVWAPLASVSKPTYDITKRGNHFLQVLGRRKGGVTLEAAQAQLSAIAKSLEAAYPDENTKVGVRVVDLHDELVGSSRNGVWILLAAVALVYIIVCANVANLLLTRAQSRRSEMAARAALGATPARLAMQVVTETVVVFLLGGLGGSLASRSLVSLFASGLIDRAGAKTIELRVDGIALLFSVTVCLVCGVLFGLVPALAASRATPQAVLQESAARAGVSRSQQRVRSALVVGQVALAFALLVGSGLALKAFARVAATPPGFDPEGLATARVVLPEAKYADDDRIRSFFRDTITRLANRPGVESAAANSTVPMGGLNDSVSFQIQGRVPWLPGENPILQRNIVTPGYFRTMGIPLLRGRDITEGDRAGGRRVMLISQSAAERFFPGEDPLGHRIEWGGDDDGHKNWQEIIGVVGDVRRRALADPVDPTSYVAFEQNPSPWMMLVARSPRAGALLSEFPAVVEAADPDQAVCDSSLMTDRMASSMGNRRYVAILLAAFAAAALLLATLGVFGLVSYATSQRTRELGIRMALGSTPEALVGLVMKGGVRLLGLGLGLGLVCAVLVGRVLAHRVFGVTAFDLEVYLAIPGVLGFTCLLACLVPALRAVRVPPAIALRYE